MQDKYILQIKEYVQPSSVWPEARDVEDKGPAPGILRGYNVEVTRYDDVTDWMSAQWISGEPEVTLNAQYNLWSRQYLGLVPTGRVIFRGYAIEGYDPVDEECYLFDCNADGNVEEEE